MKKTRIIIGTALLVSGAALAIAKDTTVYVKAKNTKLLAKPAANATVSGTLQPGDEVKWQSGPEAKEFHKIKTKQGEGYVYFSNLSTKPPVQEFVKGSPVDTRAFASSGAATKALGDGAIQYGTEKLNNEQAVKAVLAMEAMGEQTEASQVVEHQRVAGLVPTVGEEASR